MRRHFETCLFCLAFKNVNFIAFSALPKIFFEARTATVCHYDRAGSPSRGNQLTAVWLQAKVRDQGLGLRLRLYAGSVY